MAENAEAAKASREMVVEILVQALRQWKCPGCGGTGTYVMRGVGLPSQGLTVVCKKCGGMGVHPVAREALVEAARPKREEGQDE